MSTPPSTTRILIAEDDPHIRQGLIDTLESEQFEVLAAADGAAALTLLGQNPDVDLVILDIMMPVKNGYDVCREIRASRPTLPVLMLTAKGEEIDKVVGLELGADDYVTKPFGIRELLARIHALLRRARTAAQPVPSETSIPDQFSVGQAAIDARRYSCTLGKNETSLSKRELELLAVFHAHPNEVLSRDELLNQVWGIEYYGTTRTLDQHIAQLRKKIETDTHNPTVITTVHGVGYRYVKA